MEFERRRSGFGVDPKVFQPLVQRAELEGSEEVADLILIPRLEANPRRINIQRHIIKQAPELFIDPHLVRALFDGVAELWGKLVGMSDDLLDVAVFAQMRDVVD